MDPANLNDWIQAVGLFAVVASLIFVGLQMKQSHEIAIAAQFQERAIAANDVLLALMESEVAVAIGQAILDQSETQNWPAKIRAWIATQSPERLGSRIFGFRALMTLYDNNHFQYEAGFLDEDSWRAFRIRMIGVLSDPFNQALYKNRKHVYRVRFQIAVDDVISEIESEIQ